jgi:hypothetical protein
MILLGGRGMLYAPSFLLLRRVFFAFKQQGHGEAYAALRRGIGEDAEGARTAS